MISKSTHMINLSDLDLKAQMIVSEQIKKHFENQGIVYPDEWHYSTIGNVKITLDLMLDMS
jgi:hypothetical protein